MAGSQKEEHKIKWEDPYQPRRKYAGDTILILANLKVFLA